MMKCIKTLIVFVAFFATMLFTTEAFATDWRPIDPAHLALKAPVVEKDADAEAIFWEIKVQDELDGDTPRTVLQNYIRIKVFTDRGKESQSKIDILYRNRTRITDIAARTIKPDGKVLELKSDAIFDKTVVSLNKIKVKAKSFALPGVEPGSIIEYKWREVRDDRLAYYIRLQFQRDIPVQLVKYYIKPLPMTSNVYEMRYKAFNGQTSPLTLDREGYSTTTMTNVPAFREEKYMPPEYSVRPWILLYYKERKDIKPEQYWLEVGKKTFDETKSKMKLSDEVRKLATSLTEGASTPDEKLDRLVQFCRTKVKNIYDDASSLTEAEIEKMKENKSPEDTIKRGAGTGSDINYLFASLATAAGFDARLARVSDRSDIFFDKAFADDYFLNTSDIAVKVGDEWRFYDPSSRYVPQGMLRWQEEGLEALVSDPKQPFFVRTPFSSHQKSVVKKNAKFKLTEEGVLEGDVKVEYTGHFAIEKREELDENSLEQSEKEIRASIRRQVGEAEISDLKMDTSLDATKPFTYSYHLRIPAYAQRTGKRLFVQLAVFSKADEPVFPESNRIHPLYFPYPWSEEEDLTIELPAGFKMDSPTAPKPVNAGEISQYSTKLMYTKDGSKLIFKRSFFFGGGGSIFFPQSMYPQIKQIFDLVQQQDKHTITLKQEVTSQQEGN
ncbi:MAG: DUF3857 domain-containing protein [Blastocatellia bacterium]|nr:DUF3857 domain-containing protein [Blastocatellia bacterium]